jgi:hypothetical protein
MGPPLQGIRERRKGIKERTTTAIREIDATEPRSERRGGTATLTLPFRNSRYLPGRVTAAPRPNARVRAALPLLTPISMYPLDPM